LIQAIIALVFWSKHEKPLRMPEISVLCLNKNNLPTLRLAMSSILAQQDVDLEVVVADGGSTDGSIEYLQGLERVRLLDGVDTSRDEGVLRAVRAARGKYIAFMTSTDGYVSTTWLRTAIDHLEKDGQASLVWGASIAMNSSGQLVGRFYPKQFITRKWIAQKQDVFPLWMIEKGTRLSYFSELSYVVHADIYKRLIEPDINAPLLSQIDPILRFHFEFLRQGYLPLNLPSLVYFGRAHEGQSQFSSKMAQWLSAYNQERKDHLRALFSGARIHIWRDAEGREIGRMNRLEAVARYAFGIVFHSRLAYSIRKRMGL
jgi:glycosyltransferase involved in cell wall biosynthesis